MAVERLAPGEYLGPPVWQRHSAGLRVALCRYRPLLTHDWHVHTHPTIFILLRGAHTDRSRVRDHAQSPLTAVFHPVTEPHATAVGPQGMLGVNVELTGPWLERHNIRPGGLGGYRLLDSAASRLTLLRLLGALPSAGEAAGADLETSAVELLESLTAAPPPPREPAWLGRAEEFLRDSFRFPVSLRDAAEAAGVHPVYFARVFREFRGTTVGAYLRSLRLAEAGRLVVQEGQSLVSAACAAGFADQAHMTRCCRDALGFTPKRLRQIRAGIE